MHQEDVIAAMQAQLDSDPQARLLDRLAGSVLDSAEMVEQELGIVLTADERRALFQIIAELTVLQETVNLMRWMQRGQ